jgi:hypothetical protein
MRRVVILGPGASGKSTVAIHLSEITGLPAVELDKLFWRFCEGRNPGREAKMQTVDRQNFLARFLKGARQEKCVFLLTSTYMDVGNPSIGPGKEEGAPAGPAPNGKARSGN